MEKTTIRRIDRFDQYKDYKHLTDNKVTVQLGISNGTIGKSRKENRDLSDTVVEQILNFYTDLNRDWLLYGKGEMLKFEQPAPVRRDDVCIVPLIPLSAMGGTLNDFTLSIKPQDCESVVSPVRDADFAITVTGESMAPDYPNGARVLIKRVNERAFIEWGRVYVLDTCNGTVIKELRKGDDDASVWCYSLNPDPKYQPFAVRLSDVFGIYRVLMCMSLK